MAIDFEIRSADAHSHSSIITQHPQVLKQKQNVQKHAATSVTCIAKTSLQDKITIIDKSITKEYF
jgi:hypothetical protein